ncbi:hypothetical protein EYF80_054313 [Liparis tanakae]|uniref:Uncharacterized protein n=1 Tax=Liparis tanakae TaxID=230148 RepID=A0A4Z2F4Y0_9TELE|nr:hypothetical protein EYF80_054313 [Liparis tanakae]
MTQPVSSSNENLQNTPETGPAHLDTQYTGQYYGATHQDPEQRAPGPAVLGEADVVERPAEDGPVVVVVDEFNEDASEAHVVRHGLIGIQLGGREDLSRGRATLTLMSARPWTAVGEMVKYSEWFPRRNTWNMLLTPCGEEENCSLRDTRGSTSMTRVAFRAPSSQHRVGGVMPGSVTLSKAPTHSVTSRGREVLYAPLTSERLSPGGRPPNTSAYRRGHDDITAQEPGPR